MSLLTKLPKCRGRMRENADLSKINWFRVGGNAEVLFKPEDVEDLSFFLANKPSDIAVTILGVGSNLLIGDGGIDGVVIRLGKKFADCKIEGDKISVGAACLNINAVNFALEHSLGGIEFLSGIPGSIGGALFMNAGAYNRETKDILLEASVIDDKGNLHVLKPEDINYCYRKSNLPPGWIFTSAVLQGTKEDPQIIAERIQEIAGKREATQPIRSRTGGSTFKNPAGHKAWQLIDAAGCRGLQIGDAIMSELHCNFMINLGNATAKDLEDLGEEVRRRVFANSGVELEWEIKRIGKGL